MPLFDDPTLRRLEQLALVAARVRAGVLKGERRSRKRGSAIEFADYRDYSQGDDLRRLDWNIFARLERPFIKLLEEEEDLAVHLLLDASGSMAWPPGQEADKFAYARRLAGALGHIALSANDVLSATLIGAQPARWGPTRGPGRSLALFRFLENAQAGGLIGLERSLRDYAVRARRPGLLLLFSDLLAPDGFQAGVTACLMRGYEVGLLHILSPDEVDPPPAGEVRLRDVETGATVEVSLDPGLATLYRQRLAAWQAAIAAWCRPRGVHYAPLVTDMAWEKVVWGVLQQAGVIA